MAAPLLSHDDAGSGEPVILLGGSAMSFAAWDEFHGLLSPTHRSIRVDLRGQLRSPGLAPTSLQGHVADLVALLDGLGLDQVHVLATSFGAAVALLSAALRPRRVLSVIAVSTPDHVGGPTSDAVFRFRRACEDAAAGGYRTFTRSLVEGGLSPAFADVDARNEDRMRARAATLPASHFGELARLLEPLEELDLTPFLPRVECPVLVVSGGEDPAVPPDRSAALAEALPLGRRVVFPGAGHGVIFERPRELLGAAWTFWAAPPGPRPVPGVS